MPLSIADSLKHKDFKPCLLCGKGMMHAGSITFFRITIERHLIDVRAVERAHGMELLMGDAKLANVMGPNEALAKQIDTNTVLICEPCSIHRQERLFGIYERINETAAESTGEGEAA